MRRHPTRAAAHFFLEPGAAPAFLERINATLARQSSGVLIIDLGHVNYADPETLNVLRLVALAARDARTEVFLDHVAPRVYKALQLANLGSAFQRTHDASPTMQRTDT